MHPNPDHLMPEVRQYAIRMHGGPQGSNDSIRAQIHLFDHQNKLVGAIDFFDDGVELPVDSRHDLIRMALPAGQIHTVVDMLRNEGSIFLEWQEKLRNAYLATSQKPVGEGEWGYQGG
jgi:hypothetical protein